MPPQPILQLSDIQDAPIGIFDSGVGGLTVVRQVHELLPHENIIYLGDTARVPYGTKSPDTITRFAREDVHFLLNKGVKMVVVACNSVSAVALNHLESEFAVPIVGVIKPGAREAVASTHTRRIGIIGTAATIRSQAYEKEILSLDDQCHLISQACPLLVPLAEEGWEEHEVTRLTLQEYLWPLLKKEIDTLVLGCTHYPLLKKAIQSVAGEKVTLVDSAVTVAGAVKTLLALRHMINPQKKCGVITPYVTDVPAKFTEIARRFLGVPVDQVEKVNL